MMKISDDPSTGKKVRTLQDKLSQVRSGHSLFLIENIVTPGTTKAVRKPGKRDKTGA